MHYLTTTSVLLSLYWTVAINMKMMSHNLLINFIISLLDISLRQLTSFSHHLIDSTCFQGYWHFCWFWVAFNVYLLFTRNWKISLRDSCSFPLRGHEIWMVIFFHPRWTTRKNTNKVWNTSPFAQEISLVVITYPLFTFFEICDNF